MRLVGFVLATMFFIALHSSYSYGQGADQPVAKEQLEPYHKHHDTRNGHDHFYPDRGTIVRDVPKGAATVSYAGLAYRFQDGIWYEPRGPAFMVVAPPVGLIVPTLPSFATLIAHGGQTYIYCNDTYYRPRPDENGYEVINDPAEPSFQVGASDADTRVTGATGPAAAAGITAAAAGAAGVELAGTAAPAAQAVAVPLEAASAKDTASAKLSPPPPTAPGSPAPTTQPPGATGTPPGPAASATNPTLAAAAVPVTLPAGSSDSPSGQGKGTKVFLYPKNGQTAEQQARDRYECYRFAMAQSGFDPMRSTGGAPNGASQLDYERAQGACLDARGYTSR
jgi:hypothetical protein